MRRHYVLDSLTIDRADLGDGRHGRTVLASGPAETIAKYLTLAMDRNFTSGVQFPCNVQTLYVRVDDDNVVRIDVQAWFAGATVSDRPYHFYCVQEGWYVAVYYDGVAGQWIVDYDPLCQPVHLTPAQITCYPGDLLPAAVFAADAYGEGFLPDLLPVLDMGVRNGWVASRRQAVMADPALRGGSV